MRDRGDGAHLVVGSVGERERDRAHERAVAVVPLPRKAAPALERPSRGVADVEEAVDRVGALAVPPHEAPADVIDVNAPQFAVAVTDGERHRRVIAPRARRLIVAAVADHARAAERAPRTELVRNAQRVGYRLAVDAVTKCWHGGGPFSHEHQSRPLG